MKRNHTIIAGLIVAATFSGVALAQVGMGPGGQMGMGQGMGQGGPMARQAAMKVDPAQRAERRLEMLKVQLKLTAQQEPLWQAYAEKAKSQAGKGMQAMRNQTADPKLTAPERMAQREAMMQAHLATMIGVHENFNRLYEALTPEQKTVADQHAARMGQGMAGPRSGGAPRGPGRGVPPQG
ncbi:MAG: Spy/CpxP family protein refolding chaperone [Rhodocyclaceae bacterium]|nr:Spy/CpxP family protein refolding chaperone [Rhodocyclaceae bacterium]MDP1957393.1 Spy/CpxP family protein refolding chaperone [Rhodocyclaceae bacterium]